MTTHHLSIRVTSYGDGIHSVELLQTVCEPGKPARAESLVCTDHRDRDVAELAHDFLTSYLRSRGVPAPEGLPPF